MTMILECVLQVENAKLEYLVSRQEVHTVCPRSSDPFYIASLLYKMGHYFLDILYYRNISMKRLTHYNDNLYSVHAANIMLCFI